MAFRTFAVDSKLLNPYSDPGFSLRKVVPDQDPDIDSAFDPKN